MNKQDWKELLSFYKPYKGLFAADLACALIASAIALIVPLGVRAMADSLLDTGLAQFSKLLWTALGLAVLVLIQALCTYFYDYQGHYLGAKIECDMRQRLFEHCQVLSFLVWTKKMQILITLQHNVFCRICLSKLSLQVSSTNAQIAHSGDRKLGISPDETGL